MSFQLLAVILGIILLFVFTTRPDGWITIKGMHINISAVLIVVILVINLVLLTES